MSKVVFVYNLDGGLFNEVTAYAHKMFSPKTYPCNLCALTHSLLGAKQDWTAYLRELKEAGIETEFIHRDEVAKRLPGMQGKGLFPAAFLARDEGDEAPQTLVASEDLDACRDLPALIALLRERLGRSPAAAPPDPARVQAS
jgi:hypothetical protein